MPELKSFASSVALVVSSCDIFFDAWRPFTFFFRKFWPACPLPAFLIVNELPIQSAFLQPLRVGPDRGWSANLARALEKIETPYILYAQEDYFLTAPVDENQIATDFADAINLGADSLCFRARSEVEPGFQTLNDRFGLVPLASDGRARCQITLWKRESLHSILRENENAWELESRGSARTHDMKILSYSRRENTPIPYLMSAIVRGLWTSPALALLRENGLTSSSHLRGAASERSLLRSWRRFQTRRCISAALAQNKMQPIDLDAAS